MLMRVPVPRTDSFGDRIWWAFATFVVVMLAFGAIGGLVVLIRSAF
jgi:hypothetical protein